MVSGSAGRPRSCAKEPVSGWDRTRETKLRIRGGNAKRPQYCKLPKRFLTSLDNQKRHDGPSTRTHGWQGSIDRRLTRRSNLQADRPLIRQARAPRANSPIDRGPIHRAMSFSVSKAGSSQDRARSSCIPRPGGAVPLCEIETVMRASKVGPARSLRATFRKARRLQSLGERGVSTGDGGSCDAIASAS